jgi:cell division protein FtsZ
VLVLSRATRTSRCEVNEAISLIHEEADDDANIIFGAVIDESMGDRSA